MAQLPRGSSSPRHPPRPPRHPIESSLCAYYDTREGKAYSKCIELWFPLVLIDEHSPEVIHYNPASPEHISTSWGRQVLFSRSILLLLFLLLSVGTDFAVLFSVFEVVTGTDFVRPRLLRLLLKSQQHRPRLAQRPANPFSLPLLNSQQYSVGSFPAYRHRPALTLPTLTPSPPN